MKTVWTIIVLMAVVMFGTASQAKESTESCVKDWPTQSSLFETEIQYDDMQNKANPTVYVAINGNSVKMMLDTGASANIVWDASLFESVPSSESYQVDSHTASSEARLVEAIVADDHGHAVRRDFYLVASSVLAEHGYSGLLSPQSVAADNAVVIDFDKNCFFASPSFEIHDNNSFHVHRGSAIENPYGIMAIPVELDGRKIPLNVDSGSSVTAIFASLITSKPKGERVQRSVDVFGSETRNGDWMRRVDLTINGEIFRSHPVESRPDISDKGIVDFGHIGMDVLKDRVIYYDNSRNEFSLVTRKKH